MSAPLSQAGEKVADVLADGQWHRLHDVLVLAARTFPPGRAARRYRAKTLVNPAPLDREVRNGQHALAVQMLNTWRRNGMIELDQPQEGKVDWKDVKLQVRATERLLVRRWTLARAWAGVDRRDLREWMEGNGYAWPTSGSLTLPVLVAYRIAQKGAADLTLQKALMAAIASVVQPGPPELVDAVLERVLSVLASQAASDPAMRAAMMDANLRRYEAWHKLTGYVEHARREGHVMAVGPLRDYMDELGAWVREPFNDAVLSDDTGPPSAV